ncbi:hypothetical protein PFZ55_45345 [Streptomyces sp. MS2A]|nr:hypothetical protein [Streptomyces sp. MS2A]
MRGPVRSRGRAIARDLSRALVSRSTLPVGILCLVALAALAAFVLAGGLAPAASRAAIVSADTEVRTSLFAVTVLDAELTDEVEEPSFEADPGEELFVVTLRLENLTSRPAGVVQFVDRVTSRLVASSSPLLTPTGVSPTREARAWRTDGTTRSPVLQPRVPAEVQIAWPVPEGSFADGKAGLDVYDARERAGQLILSASAITWQRTGQAARIDVEVVP